MDSERVHLQRMAKLLSDNLYIYEEQAAAFGELHVPPFLKRQIEETREELERIKENLSKLDASHSEQEAISLAPGEVVARFEPLLKDLLQGDIGIERIWPNRRAWQTDSADGLRVWQQRACQGKNVDMLSCTLWNNWMHQEEEFRNGFFSNIAGGAHVRILIYDPESDILAHRSILERDVPGEMQQEIKATLVRLAQGRNDLPISVRKNLEVSLMTRTLLPGQIIRTGERMLVATYLVGKSGGPSPTMQLKGSDSVYFRKYTEQFETLWKWAKPLNEDEQFDEIQRKYGSLPSPPAEW